MLFRRNQKSLPPVIESASPSSDEDKNTYEDLGFGNKLNTKVRLVNHNGSLNIKRRGASLRSWSGYLWLVTTSWGRFFGVVLVYYLVTNAIFALVFMQVGIEELSTVVSPKWIDNFAHCFYFSVQTFTTVGYGAISPEGAGANFAAAMCALFGILSVALATGLLFARFSRPTTCIIFSRKAIIAPYRDGKGFMFRMANARHHQLMDMEAMVTMAWICEETGKPIRRYAGLQLEREKVAMFPLNWTIVHPIDDKSPLYGKTDAEIKAMDAEFIVIIKAFDETFSQIVHTQSSYSSTDIVYGAKFNPMYFVNDEGETILELDKIDDFKRVKLSKPINTQ